MGNFLAATAIRDRPDAVFCSKPIAYPGEQHNPAARVPLAVGCRGLLSVGSVP